MIASICLGLALIPFTQTKVVQPPAIAPWLIAVVAITFLVVGAVVWYYVMKRVRVMTVEYAFAIMTAYAATDALRTLVLDHLPWWQQASISVASYLFFVYGYIKLVRKMQESWYWTLKLAWISNLYMIVFYAALGTLIGALIPPIAALLILIGAAIYDWVAVRKAGNMIFMANYFTKQRMFPGIVIPKEDPEKFAMLGGGDIFFIILVSTAFFKSNPIVMFTTAIGMTAAVIGLFVLSKKDKFYPALPYILSGCVIGLGAAFWLFRVIRW